MFWLRPPPQARTGLRPPDALLAELPSRARYHTLHVTRQPSGHMTVTLRDGRATRQIGPLPLMEVTDEHGNAFGSLTWWRPYGVESTPAAAATHCFLLDARSRELYLLPAAEAQRFVERQQGIAALFLGGIFAVRD